MDADELRSRALSIAAVVRERGAERIAITVEQSERSIAALLGAMAAGQTAIPIDRRLHPEEVARILSHSRADLLLADALDPRVAPPCPVVDRSAFDHAELRDPRGGGALLLYTSGSTSRPKGVLLHEDALYANAAAWNARYRTGPDDVVLSALSPCHSFGITIGAIATLLAGARLSLVDHPSPASLADASRRHRPTIVLAVSATFAHLARSTSATRSDFESVRALIGGASPLPPPIIEAIRRDLGPEVLLTYGLTEAGPVVTANPPGANRIGTVGTALDGVEVRIDVDGELLVRGPSIMRGYLDDPRATRIAIDPEGWLYTGDLASMEDGYVRILGRKKDLIIRGGEKIHPEEVEEVLLAHPAVRDAAVIGVAEDGVDETPVGCVVLDGGSLEALDLAAHCSRHLARFKVPKIFRALEELPRNANGKLMRALLRERIAGER
jgi:acyl-CoA synthetase (AMP-forming)/AMP-acid ligase II